jgi:hypothetical protein
MNRIAIYLPDPTRTANARHDATMVSGTSSVMTGWIADDLPKRRANCLCTNEAAMSAKPSGQSLRRTKWVSSVGLNPAVRRLVRAAFARRDVVALPPGGE